MCAGTQPRLVGIYVVHLQNSQYVMYCHGSVGWPGTRVCAETMKWHFSVLSNNQLTIIGSKHEL